MGQQGGGFFTLNSYIETYCNAIAMKPIQYAGIFGFYLFAHLSLLAQADWTAPFAPAQTFIENQGQFDASGLPDVRYGIDHGFGWQVLMTPRGANLISRKALHPREEGMMGEAGPVAQTLVAQEWLGANLLVQIRPAAQRPDYFTYAYPDGQRERVLGHVPAFDSLYYPALYPGIDLLYHAPDAGGIKYALRLAPFADPGLIALRYTGAPLRLHTDGSLRIGTVLGDLIDHAPSAAYLDGAQEAIACTFDLQGDVVRFQLGPHDPARPLLIDPWTVNPAFPLFNRAFEVDVDAAGNVYAFGGGMGYNLKKYNAAGTLQWTHVSPWDTSNAWFGELLALPAGDLFITSGSPAKIRRLTTAGATTFTNNGPFINLDEYWTLSLNCDNTLLIAGGARIISFTSPQGHLFNLNLTNGNQIAGSPYNIAATGMNEVRAFKRSAGGTLYALSNNNLIGITNSFGTLFSIANGFSLPYYSPAYMANSVQGVNAIDANANGIYVSNGLALQRRDLSNGALLSTVNIPSGGFTGGFLGSGATNSGLDLDNCGNLYVGSSNQVLKYNSTLVQQATVATTGAVYDVVVGPSGVVVWGGNGFVTSNTSLAPCAQQTISCVVLPVTLSHWTLSCADRQAKLEWAASEEAPGTRYTIEHSPNGEFWETLAHVDGRGAGTAYTYTLAGPQTGWLYRLRMRGQDGQEDLSATRSRDDCGHDRPQLKVWPQPSDGALSIAFESLHGQACLVLLYDHAGQLVLRRAYTAQQGGNVLQLDVQALPAGLYGLQIVGADGRLIGPVETISKF
jgi:hypothetical protein